MPKKPFVWLTFTLCLLLPLVAACGSNANPATSAIATGKGTLYVYDLGGPPGNGVSHNTVQHIVAFQPGNTKAQLYLPTGLTSMNHQLLLASSSTGTGNAARTTIAVIRTQDGTILRALEINGVYSTAQAGFDNGVVSFDGRWLALRELQQPKSETTIALIDTQADKLVKTIHLNGDFDLDAIDPTGSAVYLLEHWNNSAGQYDVRRYDVPQNALYPYQIVDKTELNDPNMTGRAVARQMASDGKTAYTLYIDSYHNIAFVHILPLDPTFPFARCVILPVGKSAALLGYYTLTLSADGNTLYAANGALGVASAIALNTAQVSDVFDDKISATQHFNADASNITSAATSRTLRNGAVPSSDQSTLYFTGLSGIWSVNTADLQAKRGTFKHVLAQQSFTGIALSNDNRTLYAADPASGITIFDVASGRSEQALPRPARTPWDIEWITG